MEMSLNEQSECVSPGATFWFKLDHLNRALVFLNRRQKVNTSEASNKRDVVNTGIMTDGEANMQKKSREELIKRIEEILQKCVERLENDETPKLTVPNRKIWRNTSFDKEHGIQMNENPIPVVIAQGKKKFGLTLHILSKIYSLLKSDKYCTKRDMYYQDVQLYGTQSVVNNIIDDIACLLNVQKIQMHILTTSKGCIAGSLQFKDADDNYIDCSGTTQGLLLPSTIKGISCINSDARFILVVEKDAVFQTLLERNTTEKLHPCIMITGKGFPDVNTRQMVKTLWNTLQIPVLALLDADPYGIEILSIYTYGSMSLSFDVANLAVPQIQWLGILPSDIQRLHLPENAVLQLNECDKKRAQSLLSRSYMTFREEWHQQVQLMLASQKKAEIEGLSKISDNFLTDVYLPNKIKYGGWI